MKKQETMDNKNNVMIIEYGAGNLFSVRAAVERLGYTVTVSDSPERIRAADRVIFPGVGQARSAMEKLRERGLDRVLPGLRVPVLGICLGMQLMCARSDEGDTPGLGIFPLEVKRLPAGVKVPHVGWNRLARLSSPLFAGVPDGTWVYFVHSYHVPDAPHAVATCLYHAPFSAALRRDNFFGCQFHPEKSGEAGERVLRNFLAWDGHE
ncbi:MAG: imidazole glycerol phosphate synthase subunit HisH [Odoribacteraceae bacterium]|jgi:glutamine amidotransferase|nr:imidazole glycerol phosphate synthase subunit HisH [Odoribacteraceae bacterium]